MDKVEKLLRKISKKDRKRLSEILLKLTLGDVEFFDIVKLKDMEFFRLKKGNFRIIFHYEAEKVIVDDIRVRNENTYKKLR